MTNIEMQFYESAIRFFRGGQKSSPQVDIEDIKLFLASTIILAGMSVNNLYTQDCRVEDSVKLATALLNALKQNKQNK